MVRQETVLVGTEDGKAVSVLDLGPRRSSAVVYCHGSPGSRLDLELVRRPILASGLRVIAPDRPGYGFSDPSPAPSIRAWCDDLGTIAGRLGVERVAVVGYSLGALYALAAARWLPQLVRHVTLVSPLPPAWGWPFRSLYRWRAVPRAVDAALATYVCRRSSAAVSRLRRSLGPADRRLLDEPLVAAAVRKTYLEMLRGGSKGWAVDGWLAATCPRSTDDVGVPVVVWRGEDDRLVPRSAVDELVARLPEADLHSVPAAGHLLVVEHADEILAAVRSALTASGDDGPR